MTFTESINTCLKEKYCCFNGRASRSEYWFFALFGFIVGFVVNIIVTILTLASGSSTIGATILWIVGLALLLPSLGVAVRRLHDIGKCGWWLLISLIPIVGWIILILWYVQPSTPADNQYGSVPA